MNREQLTKIFEQCLGAIAAEKPPLDIKNIRENVITFRIGSYLATRNEFHGYVVDSEYNRDVAANDFKRQGSGGPIRPDIIIHKRTGDREDNLLVLEIKWKNSGESAIQKDRNKLIGMKERYGYSFCVLLILSRDSIKFCDDSTIEFL